jgi:DNA uptake protein ComE-like DNA-binding protein
MTVVDSAPPAKPPFWAGLWYFALTILSCGLLAWIPFVHAASRLRSRSAVIFAVVYVLADIVISVLLAAEGRSEVITTIAGLCMIMVMGAACAQLVGLRRAVYAGSTGQVALDPVAAVKAARARRAAARELAQQDPLMARELRIGRPDLPHTYDDGGLVDLNSAPATVIAETCQLPASVAGAIVSARTEGGGFLAVDDVFMLAEIPVNSWDVIRDRGVVIPPLT